MMHRPDEVIIYEEITIGDRVFRMEEYWEEDDSGYCSVEPLMSRHTRVTVSSLEGKALKVFDLDSKEYDKSMSLVDGKIRVVYYPEYDKETTVIIDPDTMMCV